MENQNINLFERNVGIRRYALNAETILTEKVKGEGLGTIIKLVPGEHIQALSLEIPFNRLDSTLLPNVEDATRVINRATCTVDSAAFYLVSRLSNNVSGRYLYRLDKNACNILADILRRTFPDSQIIVGSKKIASPSDVSHVVEKWNFVGAAINTSSGVLSLAIEPLASVAGTYVFRTGKDGKPRVNRTIFPRYSVKAAGAKAGMISLHNFKNLRWQADEDGVLHAEKCKSSEAERVSWCADSVCRRKALGADGKPTYEVLCWVSEDAGVGTPADWTSIQRRSVNSL